MQGSVNPRNITFATYIHFFLGGRNTAFVRIISVPVAPQVYEIEGYTVAQHLYFFRAKYVSTLRKQLKLRGRHWTWPSDRLGLFRLFPVCLGCHFTSGTPFLQNGIIRPLTMAWEWRETVCVLVCQKSSRKATQCASEEAERWEPLHLPPQKSCRINWYFLRGVHVPAKSSVCMCFFFR